jgi:SAM-dependent methyltransferase
MFFIPLHALHVCFAVSDAELVAQPVAGNRRRDCYAASMRLRAAVDMLSGSGIDALGPTVWADFGCGDGLFTRALAELLAAGSTIHAMDVNGSALQSIPTSHKGTRITTHRGDFVNDRWPFADLDGILMANSLHYVEHQAAFIRRCEPYMSSRRHFLIVEYDTDAANPWVPYPLSRARLTALFEAAGYSSIRMLRTRASMVRRASLYSAAVGI